jgi:hypothetical protein
MPAIVRQDAAKMVWMDGVTCSHTERVSKFSSAAEAAKERRRSSYELSWSSIHLQNLVDACLEA